jgi:hypothetical protein
MDAKIAEALEGSIEKWRKIVEGSGVDYGIINCPLCTVFFDAACRNCPVATRSERIYCGGTPYSDWNDCVGDDSRATTPELKALAQAELDFLISLREVGDTG